MNTTNNTKFTFRLYSLSLEAVRLCAPLIAQIARHDPDLGRQGRRALTSIHLNIAESMDATGGNRMQRLRTALGSTNEVIACIDLGLALGYLKPDLRAYDKLQHVRATALNLVRPKR